MARYCDHLNLPPIFEAICGNMIRLRLLGGDSYFTCHLLGQAHNVENHSVLVVENSIVWYHADFTLSSTHLTLTYVCMYVEGKINSFFFLFVTLLSSSGLCCE